jgi:hypothetical protein
MAEYKIECKQFLGFAHYGGGITTEGSSTIELSDEEVTTLVQLIREKGTSDIVKLDLETSHPELYAKLDEAYHDMARHAEYMHWLWEGFDNGYYEYDEEELMDYCERECGFDFEFIEEDYLDENGEIDEDSKEYAKSSAFYDWLDDYVRSLSDDDAAAFMTEHMDAGVDVEDVEYTVNIPEDIVKMAKEQN